MFSVFQGPPGRAGLPGADGLAGPPGTMLMLPVSAYNIAIEVHTNHLFSYNSITLLISRVLNSDDKQNEQHFHCLCVCVCSTVPFWWGW